MHDELDNLFPDDAEPVWQFDPAATFPWTYRVDQLGEVWARQVLYVSATVFRFTTGRGAWVWTVSDRLTGSNGCGNPLIVAEGRNNDVELAKSEADSALERDLQSIIPHEDSYDQERR